MLHLVDVIPEVVNAGAGETGKDESIRPHGRQKYESVELPVELVGPAVETFPRIVYVDEVQTGALGPRFRSRFLSVTSCFSNRNEKRTGPDGARPRPPIDFLLTWEIFPRTVSSEVGIFPIYKLTTLVGGRNQ